MRVHACVPVPVHVPVPVSVPVPVHVRVHVRVHVHVHVHLHACACRAQERGFASRHAAWQCAVEGAAQAEARVAERRREEAEKKEEQQRGRFVASAQQRASCLALVSTPAISSTTAAAITPTTTSSITVATTVPTADAAAAAPPPVGSNCCDDSSNAETSSRACANQPEPSMMGAEMVIELLLASQSKEDQLDLMDQARPQQNPETLLAILAASEHIQGQLNVLRQAESSSLLTLPPTMGPGTHDEDLARQLQEQELEWFNEEPCEDAVISMVSVRLTGPLSKNNRSPRVGCPSSPSAVSKRLRQADNMYDWLHDVDEDMESATELHHESAAPESAEARVEFVAASERAAAERAAAAWESTTPTLGHVRGPLEPPRQPFLNFQTKPDKSSRRERGSARGALFCSLFTPLHPTATPWTHRNLRPFCVNRKRPGVAPQEHGQDGGEGARPHLPPPS